jgi:hypothetical protein
MIYQPRLKCRHEIEDADPGVDTGNDLQTSILGLRQDHEIIDVGEVFSEMPGDLLQRSLWPAGN